MSYSDITLNDPNVVKRYFQRARFETALRLYSNSGSERTVLDFGGGDGELCIRLSGIDTDSHFICYEPASGMYQQAHSRLSGRSKISLVDSLGLISDNSVDIVFSLEVFEHLPNVEMEQALEDVYKILKPGGTFIVGVPNELFGAALYKGLFRMMRRYGEYDAQLSNIFRCVLGRPPRLRPIGEISEGKRYHFYHLGFDHRLLRESLSIRFLGFKQYCSPFRVLGSWFSPEIYFVVHKPDQGCSGDC